MIVSLGRLGIQDRAKQGKGGGWQVEKEFRNKLKTPRHKEELKAPQQLMALGCCLLTKSEMKSNSFCPKNSSGSS